MLPSEANSRIKPSCSPPIKSEIAALLVVGKELLAALPVTYTLPLLASLKL